MRYYLLRRRIDAADRNRVVDNLAALRKQLDETIPDKDADHNLLLASWNIRDLGKKGSRRGFGKRLPESHFYIAEVISRFDFVAVQEVNELPEWETIMDILGPDWDYIATDVTDTRLGGNGERLTFAFDRRKVRFQNIAGEIVLPAHMLISKAVVDRAEDDAIVAGKQFSRTPFFASFQSGWFKFDICTVHIYFGEESGEKLKQRTEEIERIAGYLGERADRELKKERALILLGDFNIVHPEHQTMKALLDQGFKVPRPLQEPTNFNRDKFYDQIAFKTKPEVMEYVEARSRDPKKCNAGIVQVGEFLFTDRQFADYKEAAKASPNGQDEHTDAALKKYYKTWRTYQLSDHNPLWVRLHTNDSAAYLEQMKQP